MNVGGPAFPLNNNAMNTSYPGMTLRDYFAAKAMQGLIANPGTVLILGEDSEQDNKRLARVSWIIAEAMISEREK